MVVDKNSRDGRTGDNHNSGTDQIGDPCDNGGHRNKQQQGTLKRE